MRSVCGVGLWLALAAAPAVAQFEPALKLAPDSGSQGDMYGFVVSASPGLAVVGSHSYDGVGSEAGAAYLYADGPGGWALDSLLVASDALPGDWFGFGVALSG